jgi:hypothetical protein
VISRTAFFILLCGGLAGCATARKKTEEPKPRLVGTVAFVDRSTGFALVDVGTLYVPQPGLALKSFSGGVETAVLTVSPERKMPFISADIVRGEPHQGDQVFQ